MVSPVVRIHLVGSIVLGSSVSRVVRVALIGMVIHVRLVIVALKVASWGVLPTHFRRTRSLRFLVLGILRVLREWVEPGVALDVSLHKLMLVQLGSCNLMWLA